MSVTLSPVGGVAAQFFSNDGVPLAGGLIYTYLAGTSTPAATYTSASGAIAHSNPIVLDSAGRVPSGEIWLTDGISYKFVLKDSANVLIATYDNIVGINSNYVNFFAQEEIQTATAGQTVFTLANPYVPGANTLSVFVDGVNQYNGSTYSYVETSANTVTFDSGLHVGALVKFTTVQSLTSGQQTDAALVTYNQGSAGAVTTTVRAKLQQTISVKDFGAVGDGVTDDTGAFDAAETYLGTVGGGIMFVPPGEYLINWVCTTNNIIVQGSGGLGEFDNTCLRPFSIVNATITIANGTDNIRYCQLVNLHISGSDGTANGVTNYANNAPSALLLKGGTIGATMSNCVFYNGKKTVSLTPSATHPVTGCRFFNCIIRNDILDSNLSRAIYTFRLADPGYNTDNKFTLTKLNKPGDGYAAEIDGSVAGIAFEVFQSYWDIKPNWGVLIKGGSAIICDDLQLDPATSGAIIIEADSDEDVARFITGVMRHGGQKFKMPSYTVDIPAEADTFAYQARLPKAHLGLQVFWGLADDPYNTDTQLVASPGVGGSLRLENADWIVNDELFVRGSNANNFGALISANTVTGGAYVAALGTDEAVRLQPDGTGAVILASSDVVRSNSAGTVKLGNSGFKWSEVWAVNGSIQTSDENAKQQVGPIDEAVLRAWGNVEYYQYKFNSAVAAKGDGARWHIGVIAQRVKKAFEAEGIDPFAYGILCYDEWNDEYEDVREFYTVVEEATGQEIQKSRLTGKKRLVRPAGAEYGIRYDEALALECAYLRSKI
jgi:hypothetical protein